MDWDALVQRLWEVIESRGFEAFAARLRSALPDQSFDALTQAVQCLLASGNASVAQSLLGEFLLRHGSSDRIKRRLQMLLMFEARYTPDAHDSPVDIESVMAEVRLLLDSHSFDKAIRRTIEALERSEDPDLLELLGRVYALQYASGRSTENVSSYTALPIASVPQSQGHDDLAADEVDDLDFVWQETSLSAPQAHDSECVKAAETVQAIISASTPQDPDAIQWLVEFDDDNEASSLDTRESNHVIASEDTSPAVGPFPSAGEWQASNHAQSASPHRVITSKRRSKLYQQEQQVFTFIQAHPECSVADLASALDLPLELAHYLVTPLQSGWLEKDRLGRLTIKQKSQRPPEEPESVKDDRGGVGAIPSQHEADAPESTDKAGGSAADLAVRCEALPERSRKLLRYVLDNPGQKTHAVAEALGLSLAVVHSLLSGGLGEYLECDAGFAVRPHPEVAAALNGTRLESPHPAAALLVPGATTSIATSTPRRELPDDLDVSAADIARAAKLSRLSPSSKRLLGLLYTERQALSKDLAQKLGLESEQVNQALLGILSEHVTVKHSFWRLDERVVPALRLASII